MEELPPVLSIGFIVGGPEKTSWKDPLLSIMNRVVKEREGVDSSLRVNVVFQVPGSVKSPGFEGVRTGSYSRRNNELMVQVALPEQVPANPRLYLRCCIEAALDEAQSWADRRGMDCDLAPLVVLAQGL